MAYADRLGIERICVFMGMTLSYDPSPEEIQSFHMQTSSDANHHYYTIHLHELSEGQRKRLSEKFPVSLNILEIEPYLTLVRITDI